MGERLATGLHGRIKEKPFIPRNKPKSWVVFILSCLFGLLVAGPIAILGASLAISSVKSLGVSLFMISWTIGMGSWLVFTFGLASGKYKNIQEAEWREQVW